jgi:hypothetical protein
LVFGRAPRAGRLTIHERRSASRKPAPGNRAKACAPEASRFTFTADDSPLTTDHSRSHPYQRKNAYLADFNPYVGYRISRRFTSGLGWNHRYAYDKKAKQFSSRSVIFGPRAFVLVV